MQDSQLMSCTYYPFSRCLDANTLKYLLLVFDSVIFLDQVGDTAWRQKLLNDLVTAGLPEFSTFNTLADEYDRLSDSGAIRVLDPTRLQASASREVAVASIADLTDSNFCNLASRPSKFGLPVHVDLELGLGRESRPVWQAFQGKLVAPLVSDGEFVDHDQWAPHVLKRGSDSLAWSLSYEAGSAAVLNYYLQAAEEIGSALVTTSELHHRLLLLKLKRIIDNSRTTVSFLGDDDCHRLQMCLGNAEFLRMLKSLFTVREMSRCTFAQIAEFRKETAGLREACRIEIGNTLRLLAGDPTKAEYDRAVAGAFQNVENRFRKFETDMSTVRDKVFPKLAKAVVAGIGALAGTSVSLLGGISPGGLVLASALSSSAGAFGALLGVEAIQSWTEKRKLQREQPSSVMYLSKVSQLLVGS